MEPAVGEIIVSNDANSPDAEELAAWLETISMSDEQRAMVHIHTTNLKHGSLRNKIRALTLVARREWVALIDSDNLVGGAYFEPLLRLWAARWGSIPPPAAANSFIFAPEVLELSPCPSVFSPASSSRYLNFTSMRLDIGDVSRVTWLAASRHKWASTYLNTCNYVVHAPTAIRAWRALSLDLELEPFGMDTLTLNRAAVSFGLTISSVPGSTYRHGVLCSSLWGDTQAASEAYYNKFDWTLDGVSDAIEDSGE
jgi:hypothetical protein